MRLGKPQGCPGRADPCLGFLDGCSRRQLLGMEARDLIAGLLRLILKRRQPLGGHIGLRPGLGQGCIRCLGNRADGRAACRKEKDGD